jgi:hypothetical protein
VANGRATPAVMTDHEVDTLDYPLVKLWIRTCEKEHGRKCAASGMFRKQNEANIILIDVEEARLVEATTAEAFVALSYVWGKVPQLQTLTTNWSLLSQPNSLVQRQAEIPQVIRDAFDFVSAIGERYLWVDSLCILNDNPAEKHRNIKQMADIYTSAVATLAAVSAKDANSNLPGVRRGTRSSRPALPNPPKVAEAIDPSVPLDHLNQSIYGSRGWIFQERLLSRRCIYFFEEKIYFQCHSILWEEEPAPLVPVLNLAGYYLNPIIELDLWGGWASSGSWNSAFPLYAKWLYEYTHTQLSYQSDILRAFIGITDVLERTSTSRVKFLCGLMEPIFHWSLLWIPTTSDAERRPHGDSNVEKFPSWSWAGWESPIYPDVGYDFGLEKMQTTIDWFSIARPATLPSQNDEESTVWMRAFRKLSDSYYGEDRASYEEPGSTIYSSSGPLDLCGAYFLSFWSWVVSAQDFDFDPGTWIDRSGSYIQYSGSGVYAKAGNAADSKYGGFLYSISNAHIEASRHEDLKLVFISKSRKLSPSLRTCPVHEWLMEEWEVFNVMLIRCTSRYSERMAVGWLSMSEWIKAKPIFLEVILE